MNIDSYWEYSDPGGERGALSRRAAAGDGR